MPMSVLTDGTLVGPEHLDGHGRAVGEAGAVDDGERRGGERALVERGEDLVEGPAQVGLDDPAHVGERNGRALVEDAAHRVGEHLAGEAGRGREQLAELDERDPEVEDGVAQRGAEQVAERPLAEVERATRTAVVRAGS